MRYLILGGSAAGTTAAETIRRHDPQGEIVLAMQDPRTYSRCQLHLVAAGRRSPEQADFLPSGWAARERITLRAGVTAEAIDPAARRVSLAGGETLAYDALLLATGARAVIPPVPGLAGERTFVLRDLEDALRLRAALPGARRVAIVGAGLVGVELAVELARLGHAVSLIELAPHPLPLQLEAETGALAADLLRQAGIALHLGERVTGLARDAAGRPVELALASGQCVPTDLVVVAAGVKANAELAAAAGARVNRGVQIDAKARTGVAGIWAAGDLTEAEDTAVKRILPSGIWPAARRQGQVAGADMAGAADSLARNTGLRASAHIPGATVVSFGPVQLAAEAGWTRRAYPRTDSRGQHSIRILFTEGTRLMAAVLWGDITSAGVYGEAFLTGRDLGPDLATLDALSGARRGVELLSVH